MPKTPIDPYSVYDVSEVAKILHVNPRVIYKLIKDRQIVTKKVGVGYKILGQSVIEMLQKENNSGTIRQKDLKTLTSCVTIGGMTTTTAREKNQRLTIFVPDSYELKLKALKRKMTVSEYLVWCSDKIETEEK